MSNLTAVDPGKKLCGVASFVGGKLYAARLVRRPNLDSLLSYWSTQACVDMIVEIPQVYRAGVSEVNPKHLIEIALVAGAAASRARGELTLVVPRKWKGSAPKEVFARKILARLSPIERQIFESVQGPAGLKHNVIDAIGLGLWKLGRK